MSDSIYRFYLIICKDFSLHIVFFYKKKINNSVIYCL